jgi:hypothetical protein
MSPPATVNGYILLNHACPNHREGMGEAEAPSEPPARNREVVTARTVPDRTEPRPPLGRPASGRPVHVLSHD